MIAPLRLALDELALLFHGDDPEIERVDVDRRGALQLSTRVGANDRWFTFDDRGLIERRPEDDGALPLVRELAEAPGAARPWRTLAYRPGRRIVVVRAAPRRRVVKGYRRGRALRAERVYRIAESAAAWSGLRVPRLQAVHVTLDALEFEHVEGRPFVIDEHGGADACFRLGAALAALRTLDHGGELRPFRPEDELQVLETWERKARVATGDVPAGWSATRDTVREAVAALPPPELGLCHRDLHDGQLLETRGGLALLDFDLFCAGDAALDPANLLAHFSLRALQGMRGTTDAGAVACGEALLDGIGREDDPEFWARLRFYQATAFLRLALVYTLRPRWAPLASDLVALGAKCSAELVSTA